MMSDSQRDKSIEAAAGEAVSSSFHAAPFDQPVKIELHVQIESIEWRPTRCRWGWLTVMRRWLDRWQRPEPIVVATGTALVNGQPLGQRVRTIRCRGLPLFGSIWRLSIRFAPRGRPGR
jgi:hypothetical protein